MLSRVCGVFKSILKRPLAAVVSLCLTIALGSAMVSAKPTQTDTHSVKISEDLYQDAQLAKQKGVPIVIMFSQDSCLYCRIVRESFLEPLLINTDYDDKVLVREVKIDSFDDIKNFDGKMIPSDELATNLRAYLTPTVIVFDSNGKVHHRIVGLVNEHYYSAELDNAIDSTYSKIHRFAVN